MISYSQQQVQHLQAIESYNKGYDRGNGSSEAVRIICCLVRPVSRHVSCQLDFQMTQFDLLNGLDFSQSVKRLCFSFTENRLSSQRLSFLWTRSVFPLPLCFAILCHLSLLRLLLCVSCQVLDIIYDLVLCPNCETPDKRSISATKYEDCLFHSPVIHLSVHTRRLVVRCFGVTLSFGEKVQHTWI